MRINPEIFRAYDIRGVYAQEIDENAAYLIGQAFVKFLDKTRPKIALGRDARLSSPSLFKSLSQGIIDAGANVVDIGLSTTTMLYFAVGYYKYDGGIEISASHNPSQYNGFKLVREKAIPVSSETGLEEIKKLTNSKSVSVKNQGKITKKQVLRDYVEFNLKKIDKKALKSLKIVIDTANAVPGIIIPEIAKKLPCKIYHIFSKLDGRFPNHPPNPLIEENLKALKKEVKNKKADLGIAFDGDGDRIIFVDEKGNVISGDIITAFLASLILKENPSVKILYDVRSSRVVAETIENKGGKPIAFRIGHALIKEKMRKDNIFFAGELSGHYYLKADYFSEAPFFVIFKILEEIVESGRAFSELIKPYHKYFHSGEINFKVKDKKKTLQVLEDKFVKQGKVLKIDGLRVDFKDWWFLVRPSNTEPVLRLVIEAKTESLLKQKTDLLSGVFHS